jgi:hypothetical protein
MKIIFLDIDGVLIPDFDHEKLDQQWNQSCVNNLIYIINKTWAKIIISSSWRHNLKSLKRSWLEAWLDWGYIIWVTPSKTWWGRDEEIRQWLEWFLIYNRILNSEYAMDFISSWVAIDDEYFNMKKTDAMWKLIRTEIWTGLNTEKAEEAINILNW